MHSKLHKNILKHKITADRAVIFVDIHPIIGIY